MAKKNKKENSLKQTLIAPNNMFALTAFHPMNYYYSKNAFVSKSQHYKHILANSQKAIHVYCNSVTYSYTV